MEALLVLIGLLVFLWWFHLRMFPGVAKIAKGLIGIVWWLLRGIARKAVQVSWSIPKRHLGVGKTIWLWAVGVAVFLTFGSFMPSNGGTTVGDRVAGLLEIWLVVIVAWWVLRWWARRRFRPRDLPQRRR